MTTIFNGVAIEQRRLLAKSFGTQHERRSQTSSLYGNFSFLSNMVDTFWPLRTTPVCLVYILFDGHKLGKIYI